MDDKLISYKMESLNCLERVALYGCSAVTDVDDAAALEVEPSAIFSLSLSHHMCWARCVTIWYFCLKYRVTHHVSDFGLG